MIHELNEGIKAYLAKKTKMNLTFRMIAKIISDKSYSGVEFIDFIFKFVWFETILMILAFSRRYSSWIGKVGRKRTLIDS